MEISVCGCGRVRGGPETEHWLVKYKGAGPGPARHTRLLTCGCGARLQAAPACPVSSQKLVDSLRVRDCNAASSLSRDPRPGNSGPVIGPWPRQCWPLIGPDLVTWPRSWPYFWRGAIEKLLHACLMPAMPSLNLCQYSNITILILAPLGVLYNPSSFHNSFYRDTEHG